MSCPCDVRTHPRPLRIPAQLDALPRQVATFSEFRAAMLSAIRGEPALDGWRARHKGDLGVMLLELWAYVCDALAFYDEVIADESYLRTARLRPSLRRLVGLLGYVPRPAVATTARLALLADGRRPVTVPWGTAFRSGGFGDEPPQVFALDADTTIHPLANGWELEAPRPATVGVGNPAALLFDSVSELVQDGAPLLVEVAGSSASTQTARVAGVSPHEGADGEQYVRLAFASALQLAAGTPIAALRLSSPTRSASLWSMAPGGVAPTVVEHAGDGQPTTLVLDGLYREIKPGQFVLVSREGHFRWFSVHQTTEVTLPIAAPTTVAGQPIAAPTAPATKLMLDAGLNSRAATPEWVASDAPRLIVHHALVDIGVPTVERRTAVTATDSLQLASPLELPADDPEPERFLLSDLDERGVEVGGRLSFALRTLTLDSTSTWSPALRLPVEVRANVAQVSRGESVEREVLGSGDASLAGQSFTLAKKPLTYLPAPSAGAGVESTLRIWVDGMRWQEAGSFYGADPGVQVYVVREDDAGDAVVTFGDGVHGARLTTGRDNVTASYRFGAGAASPPRDSITQIDQPQPGLAGVENPVAAAGGADREDRESLRTGAPRMTLLLGRAVSVLDVEAVATAFPGVRAARAEWRWDASRQGPLAQVWYVGAAGLAGALEARLQAVTDPSVPVAVAQSTGIPTTLEIDVEIDPSRHEPRVIAGMRTALAARGTGLLSPERIGIGRPLYRSRLFEALNAVPGVITVRSLARGGQAFVQFALDPGPGSYFDVEAGALVLNRDRG